MKRNLLATLAACAALSAAAQSTPIESDLQVAGRKLQSKAPGECKAASEASIYGVRAAMTMISQRQGDQSLRMTLWQPRDGSPAMLERAKERATRSGLEFSLTPDDTEVPEVCPVLGIPIIV